MMPLNASIRDIYLPPNMRGRPLDERGYPVPYFVAWLDERGQPVAEPNGKPDFRVVDPQRYAKCVREKRCWLCGRIMGRYKVFVIGPMCAINRVSSEPPSHIGCAHYAVRACPFLTRPRMRRNDKNMPKHQNPGGLMIERNPGVMLIWVTETYSLMPDQADGVLVKVGDPSGIEWWREGRPATRAEAEEAIESGLPILRKTADDEGPEARAELERLIPLRLDGLLPP